MSKSAQAEALEAVEAHFSTLEKGQSAHQEHVYTEEESHAYAAEYDVAYPGVYRSPDGELLVPPGLVFMRPTVIFGLKGPDTPPLSRGGLFTRTHRKYHQLVRVGHNVLFDGYILDLYERRGYYYLTVRWEATDEDGALLAEGTEWHTLGFARRPAQ